MFPLCSFHHFICFLHEVIPSWNFKSTCTYSTYEFHGYFCMLYWFVPLSGELSHEISANIWIASPETWLWGVFRTRFSWIVQLWTGNASFLSGSFKLERYPSLVKTENIINNFWSRTGFLAGVTQAFKPALFSFWFSELDPCPPNGPSFRLLFSLKIFSLLYSK